MTGEEAKKEIIDMANALQLIPNTPEGKAVSMALKALEQEPCEDAISRQAAIDGINEYFHDEYYQRTSIQDCRDCLIEDVINALPPVTPQPKIGHWIHHKEKMYECAEHWECSRCHRSTMTNPFPVDGNDYNAMYYCPKCGARMEMESEKV